MELDIIKLQTTWNDAAGSLNNNFAKIQQAINTGSGGGGGSVAGGGIYEIKYDFLNGNPLSEEDIAFNAEVFDKLSRNEVSALYIVIDDGIKLRFVADSFYYMPPVDGEGVSALLLNFTTETLSLMGLPQRVIQIGSDGSAEEIPLSGSGVSIVHLSKPDEIATFYSNNPEASLLSTLIVDDIDSAAYSLWGRIVDFSSGYITYSCSNGDVRRVYFNSDYTIKKRGLIEGVIYLGDNLTDFQKQANLAYATAMKDLNDYNYSNGNKKRVGVVVYYNGDFYNALIFNKSGIVILVGELELQGWTIDEAGNTTLTESVNIGGADIDTSKFATTAQLQELDNILSDEIDGLKDSKQNTISDLETIRSGAALGATALQNVKTINGNSIKGEGDVSVGSITSVDTGDILDDVDVRYATEQYVDDAIANVDIDTSHLATKTELDAKYTKPSNGIPKSDLSSAVQESLGKADTAIQNVKTINGESILGEGDIVVSVGDIDTSNLATREELETLSERLGEKQEKLVSGENIKTINGESILGEGNLTIQGGNGSYDDTEIRNELSKKADVDGVYPDMTVGMTRDMLGVGEGDEGEFLFRPTDGDGSIKDGFASIERIEGNSVVWNADTLSSTNFSGQYIDVLEDAEGRFVGTYKGGAENNASFYLFAQKAKVIGHKYILSYDVETTCEYDIILAGGYSRFIADFWVTIPPKKKTRIDAVISMVADEAFVSPTGLYFYYNYSGSLQANDKIILSNLRIHDLTQMFGAGNEPTTIEEFYARLPKGIDINAYNEGEVVNMNVEGIKCVGFNAWDEGWEFGYIIPTTGANQYYDDNTIRSIGFIRVLGGSKYYIQFPASNFVSVIFFDKNKNVIGDVYIYWSAEFETPSNCAYIRFYCDGYGSTYNNDICINLVHTGYRNGEYEPYVSDEIALPTKEMFPNGMASINGIYDEYDANKMTKRIGVVDLGTLPWFRETGKDGAIIMISNGLANLAVRPIWSDEKANIICAKYQTYSAYEVVQNAIGASFNPSGDILIYDPAYTDTASFANAMSGVMLYYELAEPIVTTFDKPLDLDYQVWDFGTEEAIAEGKTTPLKASIIYEFNARDTIRANKLALKNKADKTYVDNAIAQAIISTINADY